LYGRIGYASERTGPRTTAAHTSERARPPRASRAGCRKRAGTPGGTPRRDVAVEPREQTVSGGAAHRTEAAVGPWPRPSSQGRPAQDAGDAPGVTAELRPPWPSRAEVAGGRATPPRRAGRAQGRAEPRAGEPLRHGEQGGRKAAPSESTKRGG
jgi:hypothetical protein